MAGAPDDVCRDGDVLLAWNRTTAQVDHVVPAVSIHLDHMQISDFKGTIDAVHGNSVVDLTDCDGVRLFRALN